VLASASTYLDEGTALQRTLAFTHCDSALTIFCPGNNAFVIAVGAAIIA